MTYDPYGRRRDPIPTRHRYGSQTTGAWRTLLGIVGVVVVVLAVSVTSVSAIAAYRITSEFGANAEDISNGGATGPAAYGGAFNVLLVGADNAPNQKGFGDSRDATLNDVNILVHVAKDHRSGVAMSLPRDLVIPHPACVDPKTKQTFPAMSAEPLNEAYARGGLGCVVATVKDLTGVDIPYASLFSFDGTAAMANAVGGVPICLTAAVHDPDSGLDLPKGRSVIKGRTALAYLRNRHGVGDGSDLARIASQQAYMSALMRKMTSSSTLTDPSKLFGLATAAAQNIKLSKSLTDPKTLVGMMVAMKGISLDRMVFVQYPTGVDPDNENKLVPNQELAALLTDRIARDKPVRLDDEALGSNAELASKKHDSDASDSGSGKAKESKKERKAHKKQTIAGLRGQRADQQTCSVAST